MSMDTSKLMLMKLHQQKSEADAGSRRVSEENTRHETFHESTNVDSRKSGCAHSASCNDNDLSRKRKLKDSSESDYESLDAKRKLVPVPVQEEALNSTSKAEQKTKKDGDAAVMNMKVKEEGSDSKESLISKDVTRKFDWKQIRRENLCLDHTMLYSKSEASALLARCEKELTYNEGSLAKIQMFGKWINIPRKQVAHGEEGLTYTFSGNTIPARPWTPLLNEIRERITRVTGCSYNFVLINRYKDGTDYMGEHKDDEKDLFPGHPIASLTLGQSRDFVFKHQDRKNGKRQIDTETIQLRHGMLLMMKHPTNSYWYHSLPKRANALGVRINMTFRKMEKSKCKPLSACKKET